MVGTGVEVAGRCNTTCGEEKHQQQKTDLDDGRMTVHRAFL